MPLVLFFCFSSALAEKVTFSGFITSVGMPSDYRVNDVPVHCDAGSTESVIVDHKKKLSEQACPQRVFGEAVTVFGTKDKTGQITARKVEVDKPEDLTVKGVAIIDRVLEPYANGRLVARADGYPLIIDQKTNWDFVDENKSKYTLADVTPNVWIAYKGILHPDGTVNVEAAGLGHNVVSEAETHLRESKEFNPNSVTEDDRQSKLGRFVLGVNGKRLPAYKDDAMQARLNEIGEKLIPQYQRDLPETDPTKIHFRFQLVDENGIIGSDDLPNGIILVPYQVVRKMQDDSELAEILAGGIADVLQKQAYRTTPTKHMLQGAEAAGVVASVLTGNAIGLVAAALGGPAGNIDKKISYDCGRQSLALMHDAGYDIRRAPVTWWLLEAERKKKSLQQTRVPEISEYLYTVLWTAWQKTTAEEASAGS